MMTRFPEPCYRSICAERRRWCGFFADSREALDEVIAHQPHCAAIDLMMPHLDGYELCTRLRAQPDLKDLEILVASVKGYDFDRRWAFQVGADGYLVKPIGRQFF